jgi:hypothetical protein
VAAFCFTQRLRLFEIAREVVRFDHHAGFVEHADDYWM